MEEKYSMKKYSRKNLRAIQAIVQDKTGAAVVTGRKPDGAAGYQVRRVALLAGSLLCFVIVCAYAYARFALKTERAEDVEYRLAEMAGQRTEEQNGAGWQYPAGSLIYPDWIWPTVSRSVSAPYGEQTNGAYSDHVNIAGTAGDEIYAVADGIVTETAFESACGNVIAADLGDGITVKYGHLKEIKVSVGDEMKQGQVIATLGQTGMATGPNLLFAVTVDGEAINPLITE